MSKKCDFLRLSFFILDFFHLFHMKEKLSNARGVSVSFYANRPGKMTRVKDHGKLALRLFLVFSLLNSFV